MNYEPERLFIGDELGADGTLQQKDRVVLSQVGTNTGNVVKGRIIFERLEAERIPVTRGEIYNARQWFVDALTALSKEGGVLVTEESKDAAQSIEELLKALERKLGNPYWFGVAVIVNRSLGLRATRTGDASP